MLIMQDAMPGLKRFLRPLGLKDRVLGLVVRCVVAFVLHVGRMGAVRAAEAIRSEPRHRAQISRFLARRFWKKLSWNVLLREELLALEGRSGRFVFIVDPTLCTQQGRKSENTYSTGNRKRQPRKGRRYHKYKYARKSCHCFVQGLLLTPGGIRIAFSKSYYTKEYCQAKGLPYRTQPEIAAQLIRELPLPEGAEVVVLGDTAFEAKCIRAACAERGYPWVVPLNPERVLAGKKPRRKVRLLVEDLSADQFQIVRLFPGRGRYVAQRRASAYRMGPKMKARTFYVHPERRAVHSVGEVLLVFSTRKDPKDTGTVEVQKILMTNDLSLRASEVVELYDLRWQIELFFKELKSTLGFHQYRFREFERVERWVELVLATFLYLEWYRAHQLRRRDVSAEQRERWRWQRTHGLCLAVRQAAEQADLAHVARHLETPSGLRRLKRKLKKAVQREYRHAA
jgi:Transposase DDE domain